MECVLLLSALASVLAHQNRELLPREHDLDNPWPVEKSNFVVELRLGSVLYSGGNFFKHYDPRRSQTELVIVSVLAIHTVHVDTIHLKPFGFVQKDELALTRTHRFVCGRCGVFCVDQLFKGFALLALGQETKVSHRFNCMIGRVVVTQLFLQYQSTQING